MPAVSGPKCSPIGSTSEFFSNKKKTNFKLAAMHSASHEGGILRLSYKLSTEVAVLGLSRFFVFLSAQKFALLYLKN